MKRKIDFFDCGIICRCFVHFMRKSCSQLCRCPYGKLRQTREEDFKIVSGKVST
jgi:hypothetical protein